MATLSRSRSVFRRSRAVDPMEAADPENPEDFAWKRKYRQSLADVDLATQFANYMDPEISKSFLEHNRAEFETVVEARPRRSTMHSSGSPPLPSFPEEQPVWPDVARIQSERQAYKVEEPYKTKESTTRSQRLLRRVKSFMTRRPSS